MQKLLIIGNLTRDPEVRTTTNGKEVCNFTVAVNRRQKDAQGESIADFFRVSAWEGLAKTCGKFLAKGRKVAVWGQVSAKAYTGNDGETRAQLQVFAQDVEFLSPKHGGYTQVEDSDNPFA